MTTTGRLVYPQVVGPAPISYRLISWFDTALFIGIYWAVSVSQSEGESMFNFYKSSLLILPVIIALRCLATTRIETCGKNLHLVNLFTERVISRNMIGVLEVGNGISLPLKSGRKFSSFAYGSSLMQDFVRSRSGESVFYRILKWCDNTEDNPADPKIEKLSVRSDWKSLVIQSCVIVAVAATVTWLTADLLRDWVNNL